MNIPLNEELSKFIESSLTNARSLMIVGPMPIIKNLSGSSINKDLIFIDGGIEHHPYLNKLSLNKDNISHIHVGDGDSSQTKPTIKLLTDKDFTDLEFVLMHLENTFKKLSFPLKKGPNAGLIEFIGFSGGDLDHQLSVLGNLYKHCKQIGCNIMIGNDAFLSTTRNTPLNIRYEGEFSIITFEETVISIYGDVKFPTKNRKFLEFSGLGINNISYGEIIIDFNHPVLFCPKDTTKEFLFVTEGKKCI